MSFIPPNQNPPPKNRKPPFWNAETRQSHCSPAPTMATSSAAAVNAAATAGAAGAAGAGDSGAASGAANAVQ